MTDANKKLIQLVAELADQVTPVGSRVTCRPAPQDTDADYLVLCPGNKQIDALLTFLANEKFVMGGSELEDPVAHLSGADTFQSFTKGEINLIITQDADFYRKFLAATSVAKKLNLLNKQDRIDLFQAVLYGNAVRTDDLLDFLAKAA